MSRTAIILIGTWVVGGAASAWLIHDDLALSFLIGFLLTFTVVELGTMLEHPDNFTYSPLDRVGSPLSALSERGIAFAFFVISMFAFWLVSPDGRGLASPSSASLVTFVASGIPAGIALFLFSNSRRKARLKAQDGFSTQEASG